MSNKYRIRILNEYDSYVTLDIFNYYNKYQIIALQMLIHISYILQPMN